MSWKDIRARERLGRLRKEQREHIRLKARGEDPLTKARLASQQADAMLKEARESLRKIQERAMERFKETNGHDL